MPKPKVGSIYTQAKKQERRQSKRVREGDRERERQRSQQPAHARVAFNFGAKHSSKLAQLNSTRRVSTPLINSTSSLVGINYADVFIVLRFQVW